MKLYNPKNYIHSEQNQRIYAYSQLAYTLVDTAASVSFVIGSILFFNAATTYAATWLFLIGSIFFSMRPFINLTREIIYLKRSPQDMPKIKT